MNKLLKRLIEIVRIFVCTEVLEIDIRYDRYRRSIEKK